MSKTTLVIGVSSNSNRYANQLVERLVGIGEEVIPFGRASGMVEGLEILTKWNENWEVDTVSLYLRDDRQSIYYKDILELKPRRVIFNPGTENSEFSELLISAGIEVEIACSLVLLSLNQY
jgi:hypothetical protein